MAWDLIDDEQLARIQEIHERLGSADNSKPIFVHRKRLSGEAFPTEARGATIMWEDEPATLMVVRDLTDQERAVNALAESEERQRDFADVSPDAMLVHLDGEIVFVNEAALELFGAREKDELIGPQCLRHSAPRGSFGGDRELGKLAKGQWAGCC